MLKRHPRRVVPILAVIWLALGVSSAHAQTINVPAISNVGSGLQGSTVTATLSTTQHGGKTVHVESDNPSVVLVAPNSATAGAASFDVFVPNGASSVPFVIQGVEDTTGTATVTVSAPGFTSGNRTATIVQPAVDIVGLGTTIDTLDPADPFQVRVGLPAVGNGNVNPAQNVRFGGTGITATIVNSNAVAGQLITTPVTGQVVTVSIAPGASSSPSTVAGGGASFDGLAVASTTVSASITGFIATTAASVNVGVTQPTISVNAISNVGSGLQGSANGVTLSASDHGGVTIHVESADPSVALVSPNPSTAGTAFIDVFLPNGSTGTSFVVSGLEDTTGTSLITVSAPGFGSASRTATIQQPALDLTSLTTTIDTIDPSDAFQVRIGLPASGSGSVNPAQNVRFGGTGVTATIVNSNPVAGQLITTPVTGQVVTVSIAPGASFSPSTVAAGGVSFDGLGVGSTTVSASIPGFIATTAASGNVNVTQPTISLNQMFNVGSGLQGSGNGVTLSASEHGGVTVHVESADPSVALVSPNTSTAGTAFIDVFLANGSTSTSFVVSGLEGATGASLITVSVPGFASASRTVTIQQPALDVTALVTTIDTIDPADVFQVRIGLPASGNGSVNPAQSIRTGGVPVTATIKSSVAASGDLITTAFTGDSVTVTILVGASSSPPTVAGGGVAFDGTALGSTIVSATIPGFLATTNASQTVSVTQPVIALNPFGNVGSGLQGSGNGVTLSASDHGGVTVRVESANPSVALVSPNASTAGTAFFDVFLANGSASTSFVVSGLEGASGTSLITASAPGFVSASRTATIQQPALDLVGLTSAFDALDPNDPFQVRVGLPIGGNASINPAQAVRAGGSGLTATIILTNAIAGELATTLGNNDTVTVSIAAGSSTSGATVAAGGVAFDPLAPGTTLVAATIPGFTPTGAATQQVTVSQRIVTMGAIEDVGAGLQSGAINGALGLAQHGGVTVHVESSDPSVALLAPDFSTPGTASLDFPLANGSTQVSFYVQGVAIGAVDITASAPTFTSAVRSPNIVQPAVQVALVANSIQVGDPNDPFVVRVGTPTGDQAMVGTVQFVRAGGPTLSATVSSSDVAFATLVTDTQNGSPVTVTIPAGESQSAESAALGGVELDPLLPGTTTVSAAIPGFLATTAASQLVEVMAQPIGVGSPAPHAFALHANSPNPFNRTTSIRYDVPAGGADVSIAIYDVAGRLVRELVDEHRAPGAWSVQWNGEDQSGQRVAFGLYFYRMQAGSFVETRKMVLLR